MILRAAWFYPGSSLESAWKVRETEAETSVPCFVPRGRSARLTWNLRQNYDQACDCVGSTILGDSCANSAQESADLGGVRGKGVLGGGRNRSADSLWVLAAWRKRLVFLPRNNPDLVWPEVDTIWGGSLRGENNETKIKHRVSKGSRAWGSSLFRDIPSKPAYFSPVLFSCADE